MEGSSASWRRSDARERSSSSRMSGATFERDNKKLESLLTEYVRRYPDDPEGFQRGELFR